MAAGSNLFLIISWRDSCSSWNAGFRHSRKE